MRSRTKPNYLNYSVVDHLQAACADLESAQGKMENVSLFLIGGDKSALWQSFSGTLTGFEGILEEIQRQLSAIASDLENGVA